jgi:hypothetical protein
MACNAWNHPADCNCGWGGQGHGSGGGNAFAAINENKLIAFYADYWTYNRCGNYESYTNPNARCPVCGAVVFFYQSAYGGRVFFDELGPPWPKHPCTDNSAGFVPLAYVAPAKPKQREIKWQNEGWEPVSILSFHVNGRLAILKIRRIDSDDMEITLSAEFSYPLAKDALVFIRETDDLGIFEMSYLDTISKMLEIEPKHTLAFRNCYTSFDHTMWQSAQSGNLSNQNRVARNLLFSNSETGAELINLNDEKIDIDAACYWLGRAERGGHAFAAENLRILNAALLKNKIEGISSLAREIFLFETNEVVDAE